MTKGSEEPSSSTASSILDKRQYDREMLFHQLPEADVPLYKEAERAQWDEWVTHGSVKIHSLVEDAKIRQQVPREMRLHSRYAYRNTCAGLLDPAWNPLLVRAKARLVIQGQHCPANALGPVRTDAPTVHRIAVSVFFQQFSSMGWCRSLRGVDVSCAFLRGKPRQVEEPLFLEPPVRGLLGVEKSAFIEIVKGVFGLSDPYRGWWKELRDTLLGDSWNSLKLDPAFFCLRDCSGHLIGMIIVQVDDMLLATSNCHQAESHISRLLSKYDIKRREEGR